MFPLGLSYESYLPSQSSFLRVGQSSVSHFCEEIWHILEGNAYVSHNEHVFPIV